MDGPSRKRLPNTEPVQEQSAAPKPDCTSDEGKQQRLGKELAKNADAASSESEAQSNFARTVRGAGRKQATEVGACGEENQTGEEHQCSHERPDRAAEIVSVKAGTRQGKAPVLVVFGVGLLEVCADGVQIRDRLREREA